MDFNRVCEGASAVLEGKLCELYHCEKWDIAVMQLNGRWAGAGETSARPD
jgi:hypothetical protein